MFYYEYFRMMIDVVSEALRNNAKIIVGGPGFSMFAQTIMENETRIDFGVFGESEMILPELFDNLDTPEKVKGVFYRKNGTSHYTGHRNYPELDRFSHADRFTTDMEVYKRFPDAVGIETKRGCELNCIYCVYGFLNGKKYRLRDPVKVVDEIEFLVKKKGIHEFTFIDSVFNFPLDHAKAICSEMIKKELDVSWSAWFLDNYISEEFANLAKKAGCHKFILSPDGFSDRTLRRLGKRQNKKDVLSAFAILKEIDGIEICYNFFKNPPGQSFSGFVNLVFFCLKAKYQLRDKIHFEFNSIRIEPNTKLHQIALREGIVDSDDNLLYPIQYTNVKTRYIEKIYDLMLRIKGK